MWSPSEVLYSQHEDQMAFKFLQKRNIGLKDWVLHVPITLLTCISLPLGDTMTFQLAFIFTCGASAADVKMSRQCRL